MPFNLPFFDGRRVDTQGPDSPAQKNYQKEDREAVDHEQNKQVSHLQRTGTQILQGVS